VADMRRGVHIVKRSSKVIFHLSYKRVAPEILLAGVVI
jgi:hypothetical protein